MENITFFVLIGLFTLVLGYLIGWKIGKLQALGKVQKLEAEVNTTTLLYENLQSTLAELKKEHRQEIQKIENTNSLYVEEIKKERNAYQFEKEGLKNKLIQRNTEFRHVEKRLAEEKEEVAQLHQKFQQEFENLAHKILESNSQKFTQLNKTNIEGLLSPLQERIKGFEEKVEKSREASLKRHAQLGQQLEQLNQQNLKISEEATNLTRALKGDQKMQGNWGEMILERVLELSGLQKNREYLVQQSFTTSQNKRLQPDVIIDLPGNKKIIIDSKVSLVAYEKFSNSLDKSEREKFQKLHLQSIQKHIKELSAKNYQDIYQVNSLDFVLLFIPIEAAFALASEAHPHLYNEAFERNIILVTPTTLLAVLRTIDSMWQNEKQKENAIEIATQAGKLYDSFVNLIIEFEKVGSQLQTVQNTYDKAMKKLTGKQNLIKRVEKLKKLGAKANKQLDSKFLNEA